MEDAKKINDQIAIAGQVSLASLQEAAQEGYKSVLNLRSPEEEGFLSQEQQEAEALGLDYVNIPVKVDTLTEAQTTDILGQIDHLPKPALIHCASAMRAGAMALMNVATRQGMTAEQAFEKAEEIGFDCSAHPEMKAFFKDYVDKHSQMS